MNSFDLRAAFAVGLVVTLLASVPSDATTAQNNLPACPNDQKQRFDKCFGTFVYTDGTRYTGEFQNDKRTGLGTLVYPDGGYYAGEFKDDDFSGLGVFKLESGESFVGEFFANAANGRSTLTFQSGDKYSGDFKDWKLNGEFLVTYVNGDSYIGQYENDKRKGHGTYKWKGGAKYAGQWIDGLPSGEGILLNEAGDEVLGADYTSMGTYSEDGGISSPDTLSYNGGTAQQPAPKPKVIAETGANDKNVELLNNFIWQYSRKECSAVVDKKLFFCGDENKWKRDKKPSSEDASAQYSYDDRNLAVYIYEKTGAKDGLTKTIMREAIISYITDGTKESAETPKILEESEQVVWGGQKAYTLVAAGRSAGLKVVYANTFITRDVETLQIVTIHIGDSYTEAARALHEEFVNVTGYD